MDIENPEELLPYLRDTNRIAHDETPSFRNLAGGVSNRTVLVERDSGECWVIKQALEKLRVEVDWFSRPERIEREAEGLRWLARVAPPGATTPLVFEDPAQHLFAMQAVPQPHANWKTVLLRGVIAPRHFRQFGALLAAIHSAAPPSAFEDRSFFESLRLEPYYRYTARQAPEAAAFLEALERDTLATRLSVVHGDYSPKNILVYRGRLVLLDHEVIHAGDPAFDVGFSLAHFLSKAHHLPARRAAFAAAALLYWTEYAGARPWPAATEPRAVRHTLGCLLARVAGRSPLEYLDADERARQRGVVLSMLPAAPSSVPGLISGFLARLEAWP